MKKLKDQKAQNQQPVDAGTAELTDKELDQVSGGIYSQPNPPPPPGNPLP